MPDPIVSVLMAAYNSERYLAECIESILGQTLRELEFIIIDDGSTDHTRQIIEEYAARDPRVRLISRPNKGLTKSLNEGLGVARGEFIARMDADDIAMPQRLEKQAAFLRQNPDHVLVGARIVLVDPYGVPLREAPHKLTHEEIEAQLLDGQAWAITHPVATMRRSTVMEIGGYSEWCRVAQDIDIYLRLTERGKAANLPDVLLHWRQHLESVNHNRFNEQCETVAKILAEAYRRRGLHMPEGWKVKHRTPLSKAQQLREWVWAALKQRNVAAARRHAINALRKEPCAPDSWRVVYCALRGH